MSPAQPSLRDELVFPTTCPCANSSAAHGGPCREVGKRACSNCLLVLYCSKECQAAHWKQHKIHCKSESMKITWEPDWTIRPTREGWENHQEVFDTLRKQKYLWGNIPAIDVLNLEQNEGASYDKNMNLLFAASGDLRNVIKSIAGVSADSPRSFTAILNDREINVVARNTILLLTALYADDVSDAAVVMLHIWYSALIPSSVLRFLHATVLPLIREVCEKTAGKPADSLLAKTFTRGTRSLRVVLKKSCWDLLPTSLEVRDGLTVWEATQTRRMALTLERGNHRGDPINLYVQPPGPRTAILEYRKDGVIMPFGASKVAFDTPNPTMFREQGVWPQIMSAFDPTDGWTLKDLLQKTPLAKNDVYGGMFFHVRDILENFCSKIKDLKINFVLLHKEASALPKTLAQDFKLTQSFDRIEISNIIDSYLVGPCCLNLFTPLLRPVAENPHATLLTGFTHSIAEMGNEPVLRQEFRGSLDRTRKRTARYFPQPPETMDKRTKWLHSYAGAMFQDWDGLFAHFMRTRGVMAFAVAAGAQPKEENTIIDPWPLRLKENATPEELELAIRSAHTGEERYVEWKRAS
ncbi:hypothetical protein HDK77DRAFT_51232 [Phyllosticta capitalensis]